jgi:BolA protein
MTKQAQISQILEEAFVPSHFELVNESFMHNVPEGSESHFKAVIVSNYFNGKGLVQRHQAVYGAMGGMMKEIHALALHTFTETEWVEKGEAEDSPKCRGGE